MKLPLKLTIFVVLLFSVVIATCLLWTPVKIRYHVGKLKSDNIEECNNAAKSLVQIGKKGREALVKNFPDGEEAGRALIMYRKNIEGRISDAHVFAMRQMNKEKYKITLLEKCTPLVYAVEMKYNTLAKLFIIRGASMDLFPFGRYRKIDGDERKNEVIIGFDPPLLSALIHSPNDLADFMIRKGADVNVKRLDGWSILYVLVQTQYVKGLTKLLDSGCKVNVRNEYGTTPLHYAANNNAKTEDVIKIVKLLIEKGADVNAKNVNGYTSLDWMHSRNRHELGKLLRAHGAKTGEELRASKVKRRRRKEMNSTIENRKSKIYGLPLKLAINGSCVPRQGSRV